MNATKDNTSGNELREIRDLLDQIRRLMIFSLLEDDFSQEDIAIALGISQSSISRLFPTKKPKVKGRKKQ